MADPLSIIGAVGAVANIIDLVTKTIDSLREVRGRWKEVDLAFLSLASQLTALRAALKKIQEWATSDLSQESDYQALMDLDMSINCCSLLVEKFDAFLSGLTETPDAPLNFTGKLKFSFGIKDLEGIQKMVEGQVSALTLLLTAFNCKSMSEQKALLQSPRARGIIDRMETDSASLIVHRDSSSFISNWTDNLSRFSIRFDFDRELFVTRVYERIFRISVKDALRRRRTLTQQHDHVSLRGETPTNLQSIIEDRERSHMIDREIRKDRIMSYKHATSLVLGDSTSGKEQILNHMKCINQGGHTEAERKKFQPAIHETIFECLGFLLEAMRKGVLDPELEVNRSQYDFLVDYALNRKPDEPLESDVGNAIHSLWNNPCIHKILDRSSDFDSVDCAQYFLGQILRFTGPDYMPSDADILQARIKTKGLYNTRLHLGELIFDLSAVDMQIANSYRLLSQFEGVHYIIFVVDLSCYDQTSLEVSSSPNRMKENMTLFDRVINRYCFERSPIILLLNRVGTLKRKLPISPLGDHFPDFTGGNCFHDAIEFLRQRFLELNRSKNRRISCHFTDSDDESILQWVWAAFDDIIVQSNLGGLII
ncbi:G-protein alpha subunit-domain-containing protein [Lophiotrema nucula]|uniref:G-protein alpha subunit-domain-containing protein n=1 Tax=Lophiotrema nucula TaxID=690887 RepID=A0A6A5Z5V5_9PLEO|nr:G-protein alpha subunit-domain-containing protein [Lophiotrema nucula]